MPKRAPIFLLASGIALGFLLGSNAARAQARPGDKTRSSGDARKGALRMTTAIVCDTIDGYENYVPLKGAALTSDEKLLVYFRPMSYKIESKDPGYQASFSEDAQIRKRGTKAIIFRKDKLLEYTAKSSTPPAQIYLKNQISLKGLEPGDYDLTIILTDKLGGASTSQVVKFKVVPAKDGQKSTDEEEPLAVESDYTAGAVDQRSKP